MSKINNKYDNLSNFNPKIYKQLNGDLKDLSDEESILHYINFGKNEKRCFNIPNFNPNIYRQLNNDLKDLSDEESILHYINYGKDEGRCFNIQNFNPKIYRQLNNDLKDLTDEESILHYIRYGKDEGRCFNKEIKMIDIKTAKIGLIYVYYERKNEQKNQTNLSFFIKYGLNKNKWLNLDITSLFVINGHQCEVFIPNRSDIHILKEDNCSDYEGWYNGIKYFEDLYKNKIWEQFDYLCLMNASTCGPFMEENTNKHWLEPFYNKMIKTKSVACSPFINVLDNDHYYPGQHLSCHFTLIKINENIIDLLINTKMPNIIDENTVIGYKKDKLDAILTGEYGLSRVLTLNNYNICCLYYDEIENVKPFNHKTNENREEFYHKNNDKLKDTIFIKNIWRIENKMYASLPVLYEYCIEFINNKLKMINIFSKYDINYELISKERNVMEKYMLYGKSEEVIVFPLSIKNNSCIIYAHYDSNNEIKDYVISGLKTLIILGYNIYFYTASEKINNVDINILPFDINYITNDEYGTDWKIWLTGLNYIKLNNIIYDWILLINDSLLFPINGVQNMKNTILNMRIDSDFWGHWDSNEVSWHIVGTPIEFKYDLLDDVIYFIKKNILISNSRWDYIEKIETKFAQYLTDKGYKYNVLIKSSDYGNYCCPSHNPYLINKWINNINSFAIKWKYSISYLKNTIVSQEFNYLTRYLYYGPHGYISSGEKINAFIKSEDYVILNYLEEINIPYQLKIDNTTKLAIVASYSNNIIPDILLLTKEISKYVDIVFIVSNIKYENNDNIYSLTYKSNIGLDLGIYIRVFNSLKKIMIDYPKSILLANDSNVIINKFDTFFNWQEKFNNCLLGLTECNAGWGNQHIMSNFLLIKDEVVNHCINFFNNYNIKELFIELNDNNYYKNYLINNFPEVEAFKNYSNNECYYTYIVYNYEMKISKYINDLNLEVKSFVSREYLINNYKFYGIPIFENYEICLKLLPITKRKIAIKYNLENIIYNLQLNNL